MRYTKIGEERTEDNQRKEILLGSPYLRSYIFKGADNCGSCTEDL